MKVPWDMAKPGGECADKKMFADEDHDYGGKLEFGIRKDRSNVGADSEGSMKKKSLEELREERLKREKREKERERALLGEKSRRDGGFSLRR